MSRKITRVQLKLPDSPHGRAPAVHGVEGWLAKRLGIHGVRVLPDGNGHARGHNHGHRRDHGQDQNLAVIELDYDPQLLSLSQINRYVQQAGCSLPESVACLVLPIEGLLTPHSEHAAQAVLNKLPGVSATVSLASKSLRLEFDRRQCALAEIVRRLDQLGLRLKMDQAAAPAAKAEALRGWAPWWRVVVSHPDLSLAVVGGAFLAAGTWVYLVGGPAWVRLTLLAVSYVCCGWYTAGDVVKTLRHLQFDIDVLMSAAAVGAATLGHYEEGALLLLLFSLGGAGERLAMDRARRAIRALTDLTPRTAIRVDPERGQREVSVDDLRVDDLILVPPGQRISADGCVQEGESSVDQAPITGESVPVEKAAGSEVFAGTINGEGLLTVRVTKLNRENTLAKLIRLVHEAQTTKSPTQLFTDRVESWYVPLVLLTTVGLIVLGPVLGLTPARHPESLWAGWFYQAMAFLTAASPCALAIGTPAAVLSGIGRAARGGVLIKGGAHLETLGRVRAVAFDKTGTLTRGRPQVTDVLPLSDLFKEDELLALVAAVEKGSHHPLAVSIVAEAQAREASVKTATRVEQVPGWGIRGVVDGRSVTIGKPPPAGDSDPPDPDQRRATDTNQHPYQPKLQLQTLQAQGKTTMVVTVDGRPVGLIGLIDQPRPGARAMIERLKSLGIRHTVMLTGDNARSAAAVAGAVGVDEHDSEMLPEGKLDRLRGLEAEYGIVAMVGDGVNDAPALANASVGIAVGGALGGGSDAALETADVALLADDLNKLPEAIGVSRFSRRIIAQNLTLALGVIAVLAPVAAMGLAPISAAVLFHEGSTVLVVINALRILRYTSE